MTPPRPRLVAIDVDGTLVGPGGDPSDRTVKTIARVRGSGVHVVLATGRPFIIVDRTAVDVGGVDYLICSNGAMTVRQADGVVLRDVYLDDSLPEFVVNALRDRIPGVGFALEFERGAKSEPGWKRRLPASVPLGAPLDDVLSLLPHRGPVRKVIVFHDDFDTDLAALIDIAQQVVGDLATVTHSGLPFAEVGPLGLHKAVALAALCDDLGIESSSVVAFGDDVNDVEMLQWAGRGVAVANAVPEALAAADTTTAGNADDGVALYLEELLDG